MNINNETLKVKTYTWNTNPYINILELEYSKDKETQANQLAYLKTQLAVSKMALQLISDDYQYVNLIITDIETLSHRHTISTNKFEELLAISINAIDALLVANCDKKLMKKLCAHPLNIVNSSFLNDVNCKKSEYAKLTNAIHNMGNCLKEFSTEEHTK